MCCSENQKARSNTISALATYLRASCFVLDRVRYIKCFRRLISRINRERFGDKTIEVSITKLISPLAPVSSVPTTSSGFGWPALFASDFACDTAARRRNTFRVTVGQGARGLSDSQSSRVNSPADIMRLEKPVSRDGAPIAPKLLRRARLNAPATECRAVAAAQSRRRARGTRVVYDDGEGKSGAKKRRKIASGETTGD